MKIRFFLVNVMCAFTLQLLAQADNVDFDILFVQWQQEQKNVWTGWNNDTQTSTFSSVGPDLRTESYKKLISFSTKLIPYLLDRINEKKSFIEYCQHRRLLKDVLKIQFNYKFAKNGKRMLADYGIKFNYPMYPVGMNEHLNEYEDEYVLWWNNGRQMTPRIFERKYEAYSSVLGKGNADKIYLAFNDLKRMGIIILPNILEKMEGGAESLLPMFVYLSGCEELKSVGDCRKWWDSHKAEYKELLDY